MSAAQVARLSDLRASDFGWREKTEHLGGPWAHTHRPLLRTRLLRSAGRGPRLPGPAKVAFAQIETLEFAITEKSRNSPRSFLFESLFGAAARGKLGRRRSERLC